MLFRSNVGMGALRGIQKTLSDAFGRQARIDEAKQREDIKTAGHTERTLNSAAVDVTKKQMHMNNQITAAQKARKTIGRDDSGKLHQDFTLPGIVTWSGSKNAAGHGAALEVEKEKTRRAQEVAAQRAAQKEKASQSVNKKKSTKSGVKKPKSEKPTTTRTTSNVNKPTVNSDTRVIWGQPQPNMPKGGKVRGTRKPKGPSIEKPVTQKPAVVPSKTTKPRVKKASVGGGLTEVRNSAVETGKRGI